MQKIVVDKKQSFVATMLSRYQAYWRRQYSILKKLHLAQLFVVVKTKFDATTLSRYSGGLANGGDVARIGGAVNRSGA